MQTSISRREMCMAMHDTGSPQAQPAGPRLLDLAPTPFPLSFVFLGVLAYPSSGIEKNLGGSISVC